jgi:hypothetical protein
MMGSCRTGPLRSATPQTKTYLLRPRVGRAFARRFLPCLGGIGCVGPPVGREKVIPTNGRTIPDRPDKTGMRATKWLTGWARR